MANTISSIIRKLAVPFWVHFKNFPIVWFTFILLLVSGGIVYFVQKLWLPIQIIMWVALAIFVLVLIRKPMSVVYGLIGTSGNIVIFFLNFIFVSFIFATIYYTAFFAHSKVSYNTSQPYISFDMRRGSVNFPQQSPSKTMEINMEINVGDTVIVNHILNGKIVKDTMVCHVRPVADATLSERYDPPAYQAITFWFILRNTIQTSLTQGPTDFFVSAATFNEAQSKDSSGIDKQKSTLFNWILLFQILISWIFLGVFISLLYNKFRYES